MCLIVFAWRVHPEYPLVVAANRDEHFARPTDAAHWWPRQAILAGRDGLAGGTWLGVSRSGRFAALTNFRDPRVLRADAPSRGALVSDFLAGRHSVVEALGALAPQAHRYNGFNLLLHDGRDLAVFEHGQDSATPLPAGVYGLSNARLGTPWPKLLRARGALAAALPLLPDVTALFYLLRDDRPAGDAALPNTGVNLAWERMLSSVFIRAPGYGTRCSSLVLFRSDGSVRFEERTWDALGRAAGTVVEDFAVETGAADAGP